MDQFADIAETYDWTEQSCDDIAFFVNLARKIEGPVLELGAGTGRITLPVAKLDKAITAVDVSEAMLCRAKAKATADNNINFVLGDFRTLSLGESFGLILAPGRVFEHAISDAERRAVFAGCASHLAQAGILALYVWGPPTDRDPSTKEKTKSIDPTDQHGTLLFSWREERNFSTEVRKHYFTIKEIDGQRRTWEHKPIEVRWYTHEVLDKLGQYLWDVLYFDNLFCYCRNVNLPGRGVF